MMDRKILVKKRRRWPENKKLKRTKNKYIKSKQKKNNKKRSNNDMSVLDYVKKNQCKYY